LVRICLRVDLSDRLAERFLALKEKKGIVNSSELVRLIVAKACDVEGV